MSYHVKKVKRLKEGGWECSLYCDKKRVAKVNKIDGKPCCYDWLDKDKKKRINVDGIGECTPAEANFKCHVRDIESICGEDEFVTGMIEEYEKESWLKQHCRHNTLIRIKGQNENEWVVLNKPCSKEFAHELKKDGNIIEIANERFL